MTKPNILRFKSSPARCYQAPPAEDSLEMG
jgi:hypothetical protein